MTTDTGAPSSRTAPRWWEAPGSGVRETVAGVFEGGGSKGVLYAGALKATRDQGVWFDAVAGASAGAITAAMIASGMTPEEIAAAAAEGLGVMALPGTWNGLLRVRAGAGLLQQEALEVWLRRVLGGGAAEGSPDFASLWKATGIELNVVGIDLNRERHVVFNHRLTPDVDVVRAVVGSAAIPLVYDWIPVEVPGGPLGILVDGGVAANFPAFVFADRSFRSWAGLPPQRSPVLGFLLEEPGDEKGAETYRDARLVEPFSRRGKGHRFRARRAPGPTAAVMRTLLWPLKIIWWPFHQVFFRLVPWLLETNSGGPGVHWLDRISNRPVRESLRFFDRVLLGAHPWLVFLGAFLVITLALGLAAYEMGIEPALSVWTSGDELRLRDRLLATLVSFGVVTVCVHAWVVLMSVFFAASLVHRGARVLGYGLLKTFLWGAGAPPWAGWAEDDHIVRLRVPAGVGLLGIGEGVDLGEVEAGAYGETVGQLREILGQDDLPPPRPET